MDYSHRFSLSLLEEACRLKTMVCYEWRKERDYIHEKSKRKIKWPYVSNFLNLYSRTTAMVLHLYKFESTLNFVNVFSLFRNYLPLEKCKALRLNKLEFSSSKLNPVHPRIHCVKFGWNWPSCSGKENLCLISSMFFRYLVIIFPLEKGGALHLNKRESPSPKDALCQVWLKLAKWFWRRRWKCEKFTDRRTDGQTDNGRQVIRKAHLTLRLRCL